MSILRISGSDLDQGLQWVEDNAPLATSLTAKGARTLLSAAELDAPDETEEERLQRETGTYSSQTTIAPKGGAPREAPRLDPSRGEAFGRGVMHGATFNFDDEIGAGIDSAISGQPYEMLRDQYRREAEVAADKYPGTTLAGEITGGVGTGMGAAKAGLSLTTRAAAQGKSLGGRILPAMVDSAAMGTAYGIGAGEDTAGRIKGGLTGAAIGGALGPTAEVGLSVAGPILGKVVPTFGKKSANPLADAAVRDAERFGFRLSRGQAGKELADEGFEESARHGGKGVIAQKTMQAHDDYNMANLGTATQRMQGEFGPGVNIRETHEAGEAVIGGVKSRVQGFKREADAAYDEADRLGARVSTLHLPQLQFAAERQLAQSGAEVINATNTPATMGVLGKIRQFVANYENKQQSVTLREIEELRKSFSLFKPSTPQDRAAMGDLRRTFDSWLDEAPAKGRFEGPVEALDAFKRGRAAAAKGFSITRPEKGDAVGRTIASFASKSITPQQAADKLLGSGKAGGNQGAAVVQRIKAMFGDDSEEVNKLRQAMWLRMTHGPMGLDTPAEKALGMQAVASNITNFLGKQGGDLARTLYTEEQRQAMLSLSETLNRLVTSTKATNPSKTAHTIARELYGEAANKFDTMLSVLAFMGGDLTGGLLTKGALFAGRMTAREGGGGMKARRMINKPVKKVRGTTGAAPYAGGLLADQSRRNPLTKAAGQQGQSGKQIFDRLH